MIPCQSHLALSAPTRYMYIVNDEPRHRGAKLNHNKSNKSYKGKSSENESRCVRFRTNRASGNGEQTSKSDGDLSPAHGEKLALRRKNQLF